MLNDALKAPASTKFWVRPACLMLLLLFCRVGHAGLVHDSDLTWVSRESEHFIVHYHDGETVLAEKSLHVAEAVYQKLTPMFGWQPRVKTEIILSDETDASNGFATPFPSNRITLFISQPHAVNSLEDHDGWLETLILHEFVHILHMDKVAGDGKGMRSIFGRFPLLFPNVFMPAWMHEGLATYLETDESLGIGRGQSSYFAMMMRAEVAAGIKPLRQINQPMVTWPLLTSRYLYGVYFYTFIAERYGEDKVFAVIQSYSDHLMPYRINDVYQDVLGKDLSQLWDAFSIYLQHKFPPDAADWNKKSGGVSRTLTQTGDFKRSLKQTDDGRIFFVRDHLQHGAQLMVMENEQAKPRVLANVNMGARLDVHGKAGILLAQPDKCNNANYFYDLYRMDSDSGEISRLTHCQRYIYAAWSADGKHIIAVQNQRGQHALHLLRQDGQLQEILWQGKHGETLSQIDWSADGKAVVTAMWKKHSGWNVALFKLEDKRWTQLTFDTHIATDARFVAASPDADSREIVFLSDVDGVYNIYRLNQSGQAYRMTNVPTGAFSPFVTQDHHLLYTLYNAQGFDIALLDAPQSEAVAMPPSTLQYNEDVKLSPMLSLGQISQAQAYSPWSSLAPTYWFPLLDWTSQGSAWSINTSGSDVLGRHQYSAELGYHDVTNSPIARFDYTYDRWKPLLHLSLGQTLLPSVDQSGSLIALTQQQYVDISLGYPTVTTDVVTSLQLGLRHQQSNLAWLHPNYRVTGDSQRRHRLVGMAWSYDSRELRPRAISYADGSLWSLMLETGAKLAGDYTGSAVAGSWQTYIDLSAEHVLAMRAELGWKTGETQAYQLGGLPQGNVRNPSNLLQSAATFHATSLPLRGYGSGEAQLAGQQMGLFSAEYRFPVARVERGWMAPPLGLNQVFGTVFTDIGAVDSHKTYASLGVELAAELILFYNLKLRVNMGYAKGLDRDIGGEMAYFSLGSAF